MGQICSVTLGEKVQARVSGVKEGSCRILSNIWQVAGDTAPKPVKTSEMPRTLASAFCFLRGGEDGRRWENDGEWRSGKVLDNCQCKDMGLSTVVVVGQFGPGSPGCSHQ